MTNEEKKIGRMHSAFGIVPSRRCGECSNCDRYMYRDKRYTKCKVYGETQSEATDWVQKWTACGMFNTPYTGTMMMLVFNSRMNTGVETQCEGQLSLFEDE